MAKRNPYTEKFVALSDRQKQVLRFLAQGMTDGEMAEAIQRSPHTIAAHIRQIGDLVGIHKRTALVAEAVRAGVA